MRKAVTVLGLTAGHSKRRKSLERSFRSDWRRWLASNPPEIVDASWFSRSDDREERARSGAA